MAPEFPLTGFEQFLRTEGLAESSRHQVILSIRRVAKNVGPERLNDLQMLVYYRASLSETMRGVFGYSWARFVRWAAEDGIRLPETPATPRCRFIHPLLPDMTDVLSHWAPGRVVMLRWGDETVEEAPDPVHIAAMRAYEFITGHLPIRGDCLIPWTRRDSEPMPEWLMETILRSDERQSRGKVEQFAADVIAAATRRGITAVQLQKLYAQLWLARPRLTRAAGSLRRVRQSILAENELPWSRSERHIDEICGTLTALTEPIIYW